jgi:hypothetical protein
MLEVETSETSVSFYQITRRNIPENSHLHIRYLIQSDFHFKYGLHAVGAVVDRYELNFAEHLFLYIQS